MAITAEDMEELRQDMLIESMQDEHHEIEMHRDYEYFLNHCGIYDIQETLDTIRRLSDEYGYDYYEVLNA